MDSAPKIPGKVKAFLYRIWHWCRISTTSNTYGTKHISLGKTHRSGSCYPDCKCYDSIGYSRGGGNTCIYGWSCHHGHALLRCTLHVHMLLAGLGFCSPNNLCEIIRNKKPLIMILTNLFKKILCAVKHTMHFSNWDEMQATVLLKPGWWFFLVVKILLLFSVVVHMASYLPCGYK